MASNFLNSEGTDLDDVFYVNNSNAGALGFLMYNGQDLGNRYSSASTLGYNVGYKNSAGTDIGYLRGNIPPITAVMKLYPYIRYLPVNGSSWVIYPLSGTITGGIPPYTVKFDLLTSKAGDTGSITVTISSYITEKTHITTIEGTNYVYQHTSILKGYCSGYVTIVDSTGATYSVSVSN